MASPERIPWRRDPWIALLGLAAFAALLMTLPVPDPADPPGGPLPETNFAVVDVTVFDGEEFRPHRDAWVEDGRIRAVGWAECRRRKFLATLLDTGEDGAYAATDELRKSAIQSDRGIPYFLAHD